MPSPISNCRYIFYLEPEKESSLGRALKCYFEHARDYIGPSEAQQYPPHCSMVGFFTMDPLQEPKMVLVAFNCIQKHMSANTISVTPGVIKVDLTSTIPTSPALSTFTSPSVKLELRTVGVRGLATLLKKELSKLGAELRLKPVDHISLAYFSSYALLSTDRDTLYFASRAHGAGVSPPGDPVPFDVNKHYQLARSLFPENRHPPCSWSIVLYREHHSTIITRPHVFEEISRWNLNGA